ncbi:MAG TPA: hypothetical protein VGM67_15025 [Gemmatimonadaceae bacterium]|jgi:hypothetical protein
MRNMLFVRSRPSLAKASAFVGAAALVFAMAACGDSSTAPAGTTGFLGGTPDNHEIGIVVNSTGKALTLFQLGSPATQQQIPLGTSSTVTPTGLSVRGKLAAVPLGNTASVALIDLQTSTIKRYYTFASGNTTGSAFVDDTTLIVANTNLNVVGRVTTGQVADAVTSTAAVAPQPTAIAYAGGKVFVVSANLDTNYLPIGNGIVTAIDPKTMQVLGTITMGGTNSSDVAVGPDGLLYVVNTGDYSPTTGSVTIVDPSTLKVVSTVGGMGGGPGAISIDANGLAYISEFFTGTIVWNTKTKAFVRGTDNPVCAKVASGGCRGAFAATASTTGKLYQLFFGDATQGQAPYAFVYTAGTFALTDSVSVGVGPSAIAIRTF